MLIDTHCHLDAAEFDADRSSLIDEARRAGVERIVVPAVEVANFERVTSLARRENTCRYALGIHPMYVMRAQESDLDHLRRAVMAALPDPAFVGIGEIGLDYFVEGIDRSRQQVFFDTQLGLAREFDLPVILHVRRAQDAVLKSLRRFRPASGIAHAFNGSVQQATQFLGLGFVLGFGGAFTHPRAQQLRRLVADLPADAHVLETDAPDIPPAWLARQRNVPAALAPIADLFATLRGVDRATAIARTAANAMRALPRLVRPDAA